MKKIILGLVILSAGVLIGIRIHSVNKKIVYPEIKEYGMQEEVPIGDNIFLEDCENMDGYSVTAKDAEIMSYDEFLERFQYNEDTQGKLFKGDEMTYPEMVYNVKVVVKNRNQEDNPEKGIDFRNYALYGVDFQLPLSELLYAVANPDMKDGQMTFRLRTETEKEFYLPFYFSPSSISQPLPMEKVLDRKLYLPVSLYPEQRQILIYSV